MSAARVGVERNFGACVYALLGSVVPERARTTTGSRAGLLAGSGFDVETTIAYLREKGGGCDCEVLLNVDAEDDRLRLFLSRQE